MKEEIQIPDYVEGEPGDELTLESARKLLLQLTPQKTTEAARAALSKDSILRAKGGRREEWPLLNYVRYLSEAYHGIRGSRLTSSRFDHGARGRLETKRAGPAIEFTVAALAPVHSSQSTHSIRNLITRALKPVSK